MQASDHRYCARQALRGNWGTAVLVGFLYSLLATFSLDLEIDEEVIHYIPENLLPLLLTITAVAASVGTILSIIHMVLCGPLELGYVQYNLNLMDGREGTVGDLFSQFHRFGDGLVMHLARSLFITLWSLLLIVPGVMASYSYAMAPYILLEDPDCSGYESLKRSKALMDGHKMELFMLDLSFVGWTMLSLLTLGIGGLWLVPYEEAARASFYRNLREPQIPAIEE